MMLEVRTFQYYVLDKRIHYFGRDLVLGHGESQDGENDFEKFPEVLEPDPDIVLVDHNSKLLHPLSDDKLTIEAILLEILLPEEFLIDLFTTVEQLVIILVDQVLSPEPE